MIFLKVFWHLKALLKILFYKIIFLTMPSDAKKLLKISYIYLYLKTTISSSLIYLPD